MRPERPGENADPAAPPPHRDSGSAPTIDPAVASAEPITAADLPERLGRFAIRGFLGAGAFGTVYRAYDPQLEREVALKVARAAGQSPERLQRFRREARAAAGLRHPHIVPLFEAGEADGHTFLATAYVAGRTLEETLAERDGRPMAPVQAAAIVRKLAEALAYAHGQGVLHRDVKSANVMLDAAGEPHLLDFGLARRVEDQDRMTVAGAVLGTAAYLAPEAAKGDQARWTQAVDQYALGVVLYELLTGHTPFTGPIELVLALHQTQDAERPSRRNRGVPRDLDAICLKCLEKDPARRYASAAHLAADLDRFLRGEPVRARRQTTRYLAGKFVRRYRRPLSLVAAVLVLIAAGTAAAFARINAERAEAVEAGLREQGEREKADREREKAEQALVDLDKSRQEGQVVWKVVDEEYANVRDDQIRHLKGLGATHEELAAIRLKAYQRLAALTPDDTTLTPRLARGHFVLGSISAVVGRLARSEANLRKAAELYEALEKREPDNRLYRALRCRAMCELGYLFFEAGLATQAVPVLETTLALADDGLKGAPDDPDLIYEGARAASRLANVLPWKTEKARRFALHRRAFAAHTGLLKRGHRPADNHLYIALALYNVFHNTPVPGDEEAKWKMLQQYRDETQAALKLSPDSPVINYIAGFGLSDLGESAERLQSFAQARPYFDQAVALARALTKGTPEAGRYASLLPAVLATSGKNYQRQGKIAEGRAAYEEGLDLRVALAERFNDRPEFGRALVSDRNEFADFVNSAKVATDPVIQAQEVLQARDRAVADGRRMTARFPTNAKVNATSAFALWKRVLLDNEAGRNKAALPFAVELVRVCRENILPHEPASNRPDDLLPWLQTAKDVLLSEGRGDDLLALAPVAAGLAPHASSEGKDAACGILFGCATAHAKAKRHADAIATFDRILKIAGPELDKYPWHWYIRSRVTGSHRELADLYRDLGDSRNEVLHLRGQLRVWYDAYTGVRAKPFLRPGRPEDAAEAKAIRAEIEARSGGMKRFTIPCDFNGIKYPLHIYVTNVKWPRHPIGDQARWLEENRGGTVPKEVMESFRRLQDIAHENNVSFVDLCVYALGTAAATSGQELTIEGVGEPGKGGAPEDVKLAALKARAVELKGKLDKAVGTRAAYAELAQAYIDVAEACLAAKQRGEAVAAFESGIRMVERALQAAPRSRPDVELLARALRGLGRTKAQVGRLDEAVVVQLRCVEVADQLARWPLPATPKAPAPATDWYKERLAAWITLGEIFQLHKLPFEAARWYLKGVEAASDDAARKFGRLVQLHPSALGVAPDDVRLAFGRAAQWKGELKEIPDRFVTELTAARADRLKRAQAALAKEKLAKAVALAPTAARFRKLAEEYVGRDQTGDAIEWATEEAAVRAEQSRLAPSSVTFKKAEADAAYRLAGLCDAEERSDDAVKWMKRAVALDHEDAAFDWAAWHAEGNHVKKDADLAGRLKAVAHYGRGNRLFREAKYKDALPDFTAATELMPRAAIAFDKLGMTCGKLGRWDEAVRAYRRSYELYPKDTTVVLNMLEGLVAGGKAGEVPAFVAGLDKKVWASAPSTTKMRRDLAIFHGYQAIASRLTSDDAAETPAEKKLFELTAVPRFSAGGWTWDETEGWLTKADLPDKKKAAVRRIVEELKGNAQERFTPLFPLAVGAKWTYAQKFSDAPDHAAPDVTVEVVAREKVNGVECYKLLRTSGTSKTTEHLVVRYDGVYRVTEGGKTLASPYRLLALPPSGGRVWKDGGNKLGLLSATSVETPAGKYENAWVVQEDKDAAGGTLVRRTCYAAGVGPVKIDTALGQNARSVGELTLKKYLPPAAGPAKSP